MTIRRDLDALARQGVIASQ
ncbi:DeoR family transcriptional regulator [Streptomyces cyaneofuscatus]